MSTLPSISTDSILFCCKSYNREPLANERYCFNPFGDFESWTAWNESIRQAGVVRERLLKIKPSKCNPDAEMKLIYDLGHVQDIDWCRSHKVRFQLRVDRKSKEDVLNPRLSEWMREDISMGVIYASLRDVICELNRSTRSKDYGD